LQLTRIDNTSLSNVTALPFSAGTDWQSTIVTGSTLTAVAGKGYWIDTTSNACTITLPASASVGDFIEFSDYARTWGTNKIIIDSNGLNYQGEPDTLTVEYNTNGQSVNIVYSGATKGWIPTSDDDVADAPFVPPYSVDFLVIAGGGGGGTHGGGGAGGYRNSFGSESSGGGGSSEASLTFNAGTVYTITVGAGGAGGNEPNIGVTGVNSSISGTGISTITSSGGGGGSDIRAAGSGGSGGGSADAARGGVVGSGTANQGFAGGLGSSDAATYTAGGGGGGASAVGGASPSTTAGNGGAGLASSITGSSISRGGGGGGGTNQTGAVTGTGGTGGGGNGGSTVNGISATAGTANTGGGGGGYSSVAGAAGGSGVVILRMPTASYSGTYTGAETPIVDGSDTILVFNSSGSYTG
jgi:hypothetical protein